MFCVAALKFVINDLCFNYTNIDSVTICMQMITNAFQKFWKDLSIVLIIDMQ